jgi:hypothetical protein
VDTAPRGNDSLLQPISTERRTGSRSERRRRRGREAAAPSPNVSHSGIFRRPWAGETLSRDISKRHASTSRPHARDISLKGAAHLPAAPSQQQQRGGGGGGHPRGLHQGRQEDVSFNTFISFLQFYISPLTKSPPPDNARYYDI